MMILKDLKHEDISYQKISKIITLLSMEKILWWNNWFWHKTIRRNKKLTAREGEDYTTRCLLDYEYIKNLYRIIAVDLSEQKELDADPKEVQ